MKKQPTKRSKIKHPSLKKNYNSRIRQEYMDQDYINQLDDTVKNCRLPNGKMVTQLEYMSLFMKEWNSGGVSKQSKAKTNAFHRTAEEVKDCTDRNNARNRDVYGIAKATNRVYENDVNVKFEEGISGGTLKSGKDDTNYNYIEDAMIEFLDQAKKIGESGSDGEE